MERNRFNDSERSLRRWLHAAAAEAPSDLASRVLRETERTRQVPGWTRPGLIATTIGSVATIAALIVLAFAFAGSVLPPIPGSGADRNPGTPDGSSASPPSPSLRMLEAPDSETPVAGICGGPVPGDVATVTLMPEVSAPRCMVVTGSQQLRVVNATTTSINVSFAGQNHALDPGRQITFPPPLGSIWQPGVHWLRTSAYPGTDASAEIWLR